MTANLERRGGCWFRSSTVEIHVGVEKPFVAAAKAHPALIVEGLEVLRRRLVDAGYPAIADEPLEGFERFYTKDPFGNRIECLEARPPGR